MSIQDQITADQNAVAEAEAALSAAKDKLAADQAALDAIAPHLSLWQEVEACADSMSGGIESDLRAIVARAKALLGA